MAKQEINIGINPNDGEGETLRSAGLKINENFSELYSIVGAGGEINFVNTITASTGLSVNTESGDIIITNTAPHIPSFVSVAVTGQSALAASSSQILSVVGGNNITLTTNAGSNTLTIAAANQVQPDWNATSGLGQILNKPTITPQVQTDWNQDTDTAVDYIKNKPFVATDISQLTDVDGILGGEIYKITGVGTDDIFPEQSAIIYAGLAEGVGTGIKATIRVAGPVSGVIQMQMCEMLIVRTSVDEFGVASVTPITYGNVSTFEDDLATFTAQWNSLNQSVEIVATNLRTTPGEIIVAKVVATELKN